MYRATQLSALAISERPWPKRLPVRVSKYPSQPTRKPESFASDAAAIGPEIIPTMLAEAVKADVIFLAVRFESHPDVGNALPNWQGKTIVDVTNAYGIAPAKRSRY